MLTLAILLFAAQRAFAACDYFIVEGVLPFCTEHCGKDGTDAYAQFECDSKTEDADIWLYIYEDSKCDDLAGGFLASSLDINVTYSDCRSDSACECLNLEMFTGDDKNCNNKLKDETVNFGTPKEECQSLWGTDTSVYAECSGGKLVYSYYDQDNKCSDADFELDEDDIWDCDWDGTESEWGKSQCPASRSVPMIGAILAVFYGILF